MKKILFSLILGLLITESVWAQSFSSALGGGSYSRNRTVIQNGQIIHSRGNPVVKPIVRKKTVIKYEQNQVDLNESQMEKLMPIIRRIQSKKTTSLDVIGIAKNYSTIYHRQNSLAHIFQSYTPHLQPNFREISGPGVVKSNDNTIEFIEYQ
jgi:hypothetical protein